MLGIDRTAARATWTVVLILSSLYFLWMIRDIVVLVVIALFFAYALHPLVRIAEGCSQRKNARALALGVVYLGFIMVLAGVGTMVVLTLSTEASQFAKRVPDLMARSDMFLNSPWPGWIEPYRERIVAALQARAATNSEQLEAFLSEAASGALGLLGNSVFLILIPILSFLMLRDAEQFRQWILDRIAEPAKREEVRSVLRDVNHMLAGYMRALSIMSAITLGVYWVFMVATGMPYGHLLALLAGIFEFVPVLGPLTAAGIALCTSLLTGYPHVGWFVALVVVYRLVLDYVIMPWLMKEGVELHPLLTLVGALAGQHVGGVVGLFLAVPVMATIQVLFKSLSDRGLIQIAPEQKPNDPETDLIVTG